MITYVKVIEHQGVCIDNSIYNHIDVSNQNHGLGVKTKYQNLR